MKTEDLLNLISDADPESVKEAGEYDIRTDKPEITRKPTRRMKWIVPASCVAAAALAVNLFLPTCIGKRELWAGALPGAFLLLLCCLSVCAERI